MLDRAQLQMKAIAGLPRPDFGADSAGGAHARWVAGMNFAALLALAVKLVEQRTRNELGLMGGIQAISRTDIPKRTDREPAPPLSESKVVLYGTQAGHCNGCGTHFMQQRLTVDHIIAQSKGGTSHLDNLQLLCAHCNSLKGNRPMEYLRARLAREYV